MTFNEIAYMVYDELGLSSDDAYFTTEHILSIMDSYRSLILKQRYTDVKKSIPLINYQTICLDINYDYDCITEGQSKTIQMIPDFVNLNGNESITINPIGDLFSNIEMTLVSDSRFSYVGNNKWLSKIIYFTLGSDYHIYLKSMNPNFKYLKKIQLSALFDEPREAAKLNCNASNDCDYLDTKYPLEESLIPILIGMIKEELNYSIYKPKDTENNAKDDLAGLTNNTQ